MITSERNDRKSADVRPRAILVVGITGHRSIGLNTDAARSVQAMIADILSRLTSAVKVTISGAPHHFSREPPIVRFVTMAADGADLCGAQAAISCGLELSCVLPFPEEEYLKDFNVASQLVAQGIIAAANVCLVLPGTRAEGAGAYERANEIILSNSDLLIAVWDGKRAKGRGGTGDVVQSAVNANIPVIVVDPEGLLPVEFLSFSKNDELGPLIATGLKRHLLDANLSQLARELLLPPSGVVDRRD